MTFAIETAVPVLRKFHAICESKKSGKFSIMAVTWLVLLMVISSPRSMLREWSGLLNSFSKS